MRIVIPIISLERGGGTRFVHEVGSGLSSYGHDVHYVIQAGKRVEYAPRGRISYVPQLVPDFMPEADLVLPNFYATVYSSLSGRAMPVRICLSYEPFFVEDPHGARQTYTIPMPIATISRSLQEVLRQQVNRQSVIINPGIDHGVFHPSPVARDQATVLCIGRNAQQGYWFKGYAHFVQAISMVKAHRPSVEVIVVSPDLAHHGLPFTARLVPAPSDQLLARLFQQATVFVFPSLFEGFGLPPLEAMACGAPVVTTACGGVSEFARDGENCLVVPPGNAAELAAATLRLLGSPMLRGSLSSAAVETARPWTWVRAVDQMESFLLQVLQGNYAI